MIQVTVLNILLTSRLFILTCIYVKIGWREGRGLADLLLPEEPFNVCVVRAVWFLFSFSYGVLV